MAYVINLLIILGVTLGGAAAADALALRFLEGYRKTSTPIRLGVSFFFALAATQLVIARFSHLVGFRNAALLWILVLGALLAVSRNLGIGSARVPQGAYPSALVFSSLAIFPVWALVSLTWLRAGADTGSIYSSVGSLHSVRYAWISNYIARCDVVPVTGQNIGQSVVAALTGIGNGESHPYLGLSLILAECLVFLSLLTFGLISFLTSSRRIAWVGTIAVLGGGASASLTHVLVVDSGSPFFWNGYSDTLLGLGLLISTVFLLQTCKLGVWSLGPSILLVISFAGLLLVAAPTLLLFLPIVVLWGLRSRRGLRAAFTILWVGACLVLALIIAIPAGGMLTPQVLRTPLDFAGLMAPTELASLRLVPTLASYIVGSSDWVPAWSFRPAEEALFGNGPFSDAMRLWAIEERIWAGVRTTFWPMLGTVILLRQSRSRVCQGGNENGARGHRSLGVISAYFLSVGWIVSFPLSLGDYKWELSRFLIPGLYLGLVSLVVALFAWSQCGGRSRAVVSAILLSAVVIGPMSNFAQSAIQRVTDIRSPEGKVALQVFVGQGPEIEEALCRPN